MKNKLLTHIIAVLIVLDLALFGGYYFLYSITKNKNQVIAEKSISAETKMVREKTLKEAVSAVENSQADIDILSAYFVGKDEVVNFIEYLEGIASDIGVNLDILNVSEDKNESNKPTFVFSASAYGSWRGVYSMLSALEVMPFGVSIKYIQLVHLDESQAKNIAESNEFRSTPSWQGTFEFEVLAE